jgi:hypothetical protein
MGRGWTVMFKHGSCMDGRKIDLAFSNDQKVIFAKPKSE